MLDKTEFYINGAWVPSIDGRSFPVFNPATEDAFATIMLGGEKDAQAAIEAAKNAFLDWSQTSPQDRAAYLHLLRALATKTPVLPGPGFGHIGDLHSLKL